MKKAIFWIIVLAALGTAAYFSFRAWKNRKGGTASTGSSSTGSSSSTKTGSASTSVYISGSFPIKYNSRGPEVKVIQQHLNEASSIFPEKLVVDGIFGPKTLARLKSIRGVDQVSEELYKQMHDSVYGTGASVLSKYIKIM